MSKKYSVLVDLHVAHFKHGFAGIPQESRLLFSILSKSETLDLTGWIYATKMGVSGKKLDQLLSQALLLGFALEERETHSLAKTKLRYFQVFSHGLKVLSDIFRVKHKNYKLSPSLDLGIIWRNFFQNTLPFSDFESLLKSQFAITNLSWHRKQLTLIPPALESSDYDFVVCQEARHVRFSPNTTPIIRYHDAIPLLFPDTVANARSPKVHYSSVKKCEKKGIFVCNSPVARDELSKISQLAASRAHVIPCIIPTMERRTVSPFEFRNIAFSHVSQSSLGNNWPEEVVGKWMTQGSKSEVIPEFIMTLSTIEPKKNHIRLIQAWQKLRHVSGKDIKLLIVGSPGWRYEETIEKIKPYVSKGNILHLEKVSQETLSCLYSTAKCFVFPSITEGFGMPPCEAMQCGCPVALSDIPAHRYIAGDSASYFSPYNTEEIATTLFSLLYSENSEINRTEKINKGLENVKRLSKSTILPQWEALFEELYESRSKKTGKKSQLRRIFQGT